MKYIGLAAVALLMALQNFFTKQYNRKASAFNVWFYSGMGALGALLFFLINAHFRVQWIPAVVPYAACFAFFIGCAIIGGALAIRTGLFSLSTLAISYSLIIPTLYGVLFLEEAIGILGYTGIVLLLLSLFLLNKQKEEEGKFSLQWLIWVFVAFAGNGLCSTVQKMQQIAFVGAYKNELMIYAEIMLAVLFLLTGWLTGREKGKEMQGASVLGLSWGVANGIVNYLVMVLTGVLPTALLFPMISAGGIVAAFVLAITIYRERLSALQITGYICGTISVILLNL